MKVNANSSSAIRDKAPLTVTPSSVSGTLPECLSVCSGLGPSVALKGKDDSRGETLLTRTAHEPVLSAQHLTLGNNKDHLQMKHHVPSLPRGSEHLQAGVQPVMTAQVLRLGEVGEPEGGDRAPPGRGAAGKDSSGAEAG